MRWNTTKTRSLPVLVLAAGFLAAPLCLTGCSSDEIAEPGTVDAGGAGDGGALGDSGEGGDSGGGGGVVVGCAAAADCDDGLACTTDTCGDDGACAWTIDAGSCLIGGACYSDGDAGASACVQCDPAASQTAWTDAGEGDACDDGDACTKADVCDADGVCVSGPVDPCDDGEPCTADGCEPSTGCTHAPLDGGSCDDGDPCSTGDTCVHGACAGLGGCDDGNPCTDDSCDAPGACTHTDNELLCEDGDACTTGDACVDGACLPGAATDCDDEDSCTIDLCEPFAGCSHLPTKNACCSDLGAVCNDGNPCTDDLCDPTTAACSAIPNSAPCNDGDACTLADTCTATVCQGTVDDCDDSNDCTLDSCDSGAGCQHAPTNEGNACDDGLACSTGDVCKAGVCEADTTDCKCSPTFGPVAAKLVSAAISTTGNPGDALDLDGDPTTCAPAGNCSGGAHNALAAIAGFANTSLQGAVEDGSVMLLVDFQTFGQGPVTMALHQGALDAGNSGCDFQTQSCQYTVDPSLLDATTCAPVVALDGTLTGESLVGGGKGTNFPFSIPFGDSALSIEIFDVQIAGTVKQANGQITAFEDVVLGGAVPKASIKAALDQLPADALPIPKDTIAQLLDTLVASDIDTDGDGVKESASIGLKLSGIPATLVGVTGD